MRFLLLSLLVIVSSLNASSSKSIESLHLTTGDVTLTYPAPETELDVAQFLSSLVGSQLVHHTNLNEDDIKVFLESFDSPRMVLDTLVDLEADTFTGGQALTYIIHQELRRVLQDLSMLEGDTVVLRLAANEKIGDRLFEIFSKIESFNLKYLPLFFAPCHLGMAEFYGLEYRIEACLSRYSKKELERLNALNEASPQESEDSDASEGTIEEDQGSQATVWDYFGVSDWLFSWIY